MHDCHVRLMSFFFNDTATTEIYTLSLHDALPISVSMRSIGDGTALGTGVQLYSHWLFPLFASVECGEGDRKSTRLNSSHANISYAVFCLKKKKTTHTSLIPNSSDT